MIAKISASRQFLQFKPRRPEDLGWESIFQPFVE
jgi:hypothetical protein